MSPTSDGRFKQFEHIKCEIGQCGRRTVLLCVVYRPQPSKKKGLSVPQFMEEFDAFLEQAKTIAHDLILVGDLNFHLNNSPTHIKGHMLDVVVIRKDSHILHSTPQVYPSGIGDGRGKSLLDHYAIQFDLQIPTNHKPPHAISYRKTKGISITNFRHDIENLVLSYTDPCGIASG